jgi:hypothetical protein
MIPDLFWQFYIIGILAHKLFATLLFTDIVKHMYLFTFFSHIKLGLVSTTVLVLSLFEDHSTYLSHSALSYNIFFWTNPGD